jgi:hypothetical protein
VWDRLHGTLRADVPQRAITIGVPELRDPAALTLGKVLASPFRQQRETWRWRSRTLDSSHGRSVSRV